MMAMLVLMFSCKGRQTAAPLDDADTTTEKVTADTAAVDSQEMLIMNTPTNCLMISSSILLPTRIYRWIVWHFR